MSDDISQRRASAGTSAQQPIEELFDSLVEEVEKRHQQDYRKHLASPVIFIPMIFNLLIAGFLICLVAWLFFVQSPEDIWWIVFGAVIALAYIATLMLLIEESRYKLGRQPTNRKYITACLSAIELLYPNDQTLTPEMLTELEAIADDELESIATRRVPLTHPALVALAAILSVQIVQSTLFDFVGQLIRASILPFLAVAVYLVFSTVGSINETAARKNALLVVRSALKRKKVARLAALARQVTPPEAN